MITYKYVINKLCRRPWHASAPCKLTIYTYLFARWRCCSGMTLSLYLFARWHLYRHVGYLRHQQQVDLWPFDPESGVQVTCDLGYLCANFSLPRPLYSWLRPDVHDRRQTASSLNGGITTDYYYTAIQAACTLWYWLIEADLEIGRQKYKQQNFF